MTRSERHLAIGAVSEAISGTGGWIVDHTQFSNLAIAIRFALPPRGLDEFSHQIAAAGVLLDRSSLAALQALAGQPWDGDEEIAGSLNVTFIHDDPDLRQVVPAIPG